MERRHFLVAAAIGSLAGPTPALAQATGSAVGRDRIASSGAMALSEGSTIHATPAVRQLIDQMTPTGQLARHWIRFLNGIGGADGLTVDDVVTPDVRCIELELAGLPGDINTLRSFRGSMNSAIEDGFQLLEEMIVYPGQNIVEVKLYGGGKHVGPVLGVPPTGRMLYYDVQTLNLFRGDKMALRWDRTNLVQKVQELARG